MGALAALTASLCWAVASILFTRLRAEIGPVGLNLLKCALALAALAATRALTAGNAPFAGIGYGEAGWLALSGVIGLAVGDSFLFLAFSRIGPRRTLLLSTTTPPITAMLAWPVLGEALGPGSWLGMALTLGGVAWVIAERAPAPPPSPNADPPPGTGHAAPVVSPSAATAVGVAAGLVWAFCQGLANVLTKLGGREATALDITLVRLSAGVLALVVSAVATEGLRPTLYPLRRRRTLRRLATATFVGTYLGVWLQIAGLRYTAHAGVAATLSSTSPLFVLPLAAAFLDDRPSPRAVIGAAVAVAGIAVLFLTGS
jgi:drug/metabolite transporter (DMT)-like permease